MPKSGYLVIADITGYTRFLTGSELDHAQGVLEDLFKVILDHLHSPLVLSNIQGDAFLSFASDETITSGAQIYDAVEALYFGYREKLKSIIDNTTCTCRACSNASKLDLKFIIHHGQFVVQKFGDRRELVGSDVILLHRLLKNDVVEKTGIKGYGLFTSAAVKAMDIAVIGEEGIDYETELDKFGTLKGRVIDFHKHWQVHYETHPIVIADKDNWFAPVTGEIPFPPAQVWEAFVNTETRIMWSNQVDSVDRLVGDKGHLRTGAVEHCAHGNYEFDVRYVDVRAPHLMTCENSMPFNGTMLYSITFAATENGTRITGAAVAPRTDGWIRGLLLSTMANLLMKKQIVKGLTAAVTDVSAYLETHMTATPDALAIAESEVTKFTGGMLTSKE